jgi:hypothetical protein
VLVKQVEAYFIHLNPRLEGEISGNAAQVSAVVPLLAVSTGRPALPRARGPVSEALLAALHRAPGPVPAPAVGDGDALADEDLQLALYACYELHYRGFDGVDDGWEWEPALVAFRRHLERAFERGLRHAVRDAPAEAPSLSTYMETAGDLAQMREFAIHRSLYQLKEADPHTWAIPRVTGAAKALLVHIQADEYGAGDVAAMHSTLFADTLRALDLDDAYGAYLDAVPAPTLATVNLISLFGLHRAWRGALLGHLAAFEMTSVEPMGRYARAVRRLGLPPHAARFYDVHVEADAEHELLAGHMLDALLDEEPHLRADVEFGATALTEVERRFATHLLDAWAAGRSSLRT